MALARATLSLFVAALACTPAPDEPPPPPAKVAEVPEPPGLGGIEGCWSKPGDASVLCFGPTRTAFDSPYATMQSRVARIDSEAGIVTIRERPECVVSKLTGLTAEREAEPEQAPTRLTLEGQRLVALGANGARMPFERSDRALPEDVCTAEAKASRAEIWPPFWALVERTRDAAPSCAKRKAYPTDCCLEHAEKLRDALAVGPSEQLAAFRTALAFALARANTYELLGAASVVRGGCSEACFDEVRGWLVARGREAFERALEDPQHLGDLVLGDERPACPDILSTPKRAHQQRALTAPDQAELPLPLRELEPSGRYWTSDELAERYPKLCRRFGGC